MDKTTFDTRMDEMFLPFYCGRADCNMGHLMEQDEDGDWSDYAQCQCGASIEEAKAQLRTLVNDVCSELELTNTQRTKLATILKADTNQLEKGTE